MSGPRSGGSIYDCQVNSGANQASEWSEEFHGATTKIDTSVYSAILHKARQGTASLPVVRSYKDGLRVGCTFITNSAFKRLYELHQSFLSGQDTKTHQEGQ